MYELLVIIAIVIIIAVYQKNSNAICVSSRRLECKTVIVTGGTAGIGLHIATDLARKGARVIIACPFTEEGTNARKQIVQETKNENVVFKHLDLGSLKSIRRFAADILKTEDRLDILINNAGIGIPSDTLTADGMQLIMQVNYYGPFLLTLLLLPLLKKTGTSDEATRIINTASVLHNFGQVDLDNLNRMNYWFKVQIYSNSKICLVLFAHELTKRLKGSNVVINSVDPGLVATRIYDSAHVTIGAIVKLICNIFFKTPWQGAQTTLHAALDVKAGQLSGAYFKNCEVKKAAKRAYCDKTANELWEQSVRLVKLTKNEVDQCFQSL